MYNHSCAKSLFQSLPLAVLALALATSELLSQPADTVTTPRLIWSDERIAQVNLHAFSHSGDLMALMNYEEIKIWNIRTGAFVRKYPTPTPRYYLAIAFSPDDSDLVVLDKWEWMGMPIDKPLHPSVLHQAFIHLSTGKSSFADSVVLPDGKWALSPSGDHIVAITPEGTISLHNMRTYEELALQHLSRDTEVAEDPGSNGASRISRKEFRNIVSRRLQDAPIVMFGPNGKNIIAVLDGLVRILDPNTLEEVHEVVGNLRYNSWKDDFKVIGDGLFIGHSQPDSYPRVYNSMTGEPIALQTTDPTSSHGRGWGPSDAVLTTGGKYILSRYYLTRYNPMGDVGEATGMDTLLVVPTDHPETRWGIVLYSKMEILDVLPGSTEELILGDGNSIVLLNLRTHALHSITPSGARADELLTYDAEIRESIKAVWQGFAQIPLPKNDARGKQEHWLFPGGRGPTDIPISPKGDAAALFTDTTGTLLYLDGRHVMQRMESGWSRSALCFVNDTMLLVREWEKPPYTPGTMIDDLTPPAHKNADGKYEQSPKLEMKSRARLYKLPSFTLIRELAPLNQFASVDPFGGTLVVLYGIHDGVLLYDVMSDQVVRKFPAGLNTEVYAVAVSQDKKWLATTCGDGQLWRVSDGALKCRFGRGGRMLFAPNSRYMLYATDTNVWSYDLINEQATNIARGRYAELGLSTGGDQMAVLNWGASETAGAMVYETPTEWRRRDAPFDPEKSFLTLKFYIPNDAREAMDTDGKPFAKYSRTSAVLEVLDAEHHLVQKLIDGTLHRGKWHEWDWEGGSHPKGKYFMHVEIGGKVHEEEMWLR